MNLSDHEHRMVEQSRRKSVMWIDGKEMVADLLTCGEKIRECGAFIQHGRFAVSMSSKWLEAIAVYLDVESVAEAIDIIDKTMGIHLVCDYSVMSGDCTVGVTSES